MGESGRRYPLANRDDNVEAGDEFAAWAAGVIRHEAAIDVDIFEDRERQLTIGESAQGLEFKADRKSSETGRLAIEVQELSRAGRWVDGGIIRASKQNTLVYVQGVANEFFYAFVLRDLLCYFYGAKPKLDEKGGRDPKRPTSRVFYLPFASCNRMSIAYWRDGQEQKVDGFKWLRLGLERKDLSVYADDIPWG